MAGGFMGGALGSMLFGGMGGGYGIGGSGIGLFQILIFGAIIYFIYSRFFKGKDNGYQQQANAPPFFQTPPNEDDGIAAIQATDPSFSPEAFKEFAQDIFFQVQAGWMRRDINTYKHLLGQSLIRQYEEQLDEMRQKGQINRLENIAVRHVDIVDAGIDGNEEFIVVEFKANLLDYTVDEKTQGVISGSQTEPVKFSERWSWARSRGSRTWLLEGIELS